MGKLSGGLSPSRGAHFDNNPATPQCTTDWIRHTAFCVVLSCIYLCFPRTQNTGFRKTKLQKQRDLRKSVVLIGKHSCKHYTLNIVLDIPAHPFSHFEAELHPLISSQHTMVAIYTQILVYTKKHKTQDTKTQDTRHTLQISEQSYML